MRQDRAQENVKLSQQLEFLLHQKEALEAEMKGAGQEIQQYHTLMQNELMSWQTTVTNNKQRVVEMEREMSELRLKTQQEVSRVHDITAQKDREARYFKLVVFADISSWLFSQIAIFFKIFH
jgi:hypothetical protein